MIGAGRTHLTYLKKLFYFNHLLGLGLGAAFPFFSALFIGPEVLQPVFFVACLLAGFGTGAAQFVFVRQTLKSQLKQQVELLRPLAGGHEETIEAAATVEGMEQTLVDSVSRVADLVRHLVSQVDTLFPRYRSLSEDSDYLFQRAQDGLQAATKTRQDVTAMVEKQRAIGERTESFSHRTQEEASLSRQLSAGLEEMAEALETTTEKFLETTATVDQMTSSVTEVASQAKQIAHSVEETSRSLDATGDSLKRIGEGATTTARATEGVLKDAESGVAVVDEAIAEMDRIERESHGAREAMERLARQTGEVTKIISVIRELVSDTELLAFNAAIIAAQAGEEGRGFSVVADEIRDLADRTAGSAGEIHRIIEGIDQDTRQVTAAVDATGERIGRGRELTLSTGKALRKIVDSSRQTAADSEEIAGLTASEGERAGALIREAGDSLRSVRAIARAMEEQQLAIVRIQEGVTQMKSATDQISDGMEEQVRANRDFDRSLAEREEQIGAILEDNQAQLEISERVFAHFAASADRLQRNADKVDGVREKVEELELVSRQLRERVTDFGGQGFAE